jgi:prepilin-type processing-associated H-X9-DG protein/prepilin-type N-terminal cleavage/methylation domain-containing protein
MKNNRYGFTLLEILVCIGIIALLSAIVVPVTTKVREKSRQATCTSNLHQWSLAFNAYVQDNDSCYPSERHWINEKAFDTNKIVACPSFTCVETTGNDCRGRYLSKGYSYNGFLSFAVENTNSGLPEPRIAYTTTTILLMDGYYPRGHNIFGNTELAKILDQEKDDPEVGLVWRRHQGGGNVLFCDGHVKWLRPESISTESFNDGVHPSFDFRPKSGK